MAISAPDRLGKYFDRVLDAYRTSVGPSGTGVPREMLVKAAKIDADSRTGYVFNSTIAGIEEADAILLVGTNPRWEAPVLNARIRKRWLETGLPIGLIGEEYDLTYDVNFIGNRATFLEQILEDDHSFAKILANANRPMLILGMNALTRADGEAVLGLCRRIADKFNLIKTSTNPTNNRHSRKRS